MSLGTIFIWEFDSGEVTGGSSSVATTAKDFACDQCDQSFGAMEDVHEHIKNVHLKIDSKFLCK